MCIGETLGAVRSQRFWCHKPHAPSVGVHISVQYDKRVGCEERRALVAVGEGAALHHLLGENRCQLEWISLLLVLLRVRGFDER